MSQGKLAVPGSVKGLDYLSAYLRTSRVEYLMAEIPGLLTILFIGASSLERLVAPTVIECLAVFILLYFMGFMINAYTDQEIDKRYTIFKNRIPEAVSLIGQSRVRAIIAIQIALATVITAHISYTMGSWVPLALVAAGTFFGVGYSIPPLQFKVRGWMHAVSLTLSAFLIPATFIYFIISEGRVAQAPMIIILGFSILHYGIAFANQAIDYLEDKAGGVSSPPVLWGMTTSLKVALVTIAVGMVIEFFGVYLLLSVAPSGLAFLPGLGAAQLFVLLVPIIVLGYYIPVSGMWKMYRASITRPIEQATQYMKEICHYNRWQASGIMGLAVVTGILFFGAMAG
jgi:4-hydroxybenzoate polyprenyltransferase